MFRSPDRFWILLLVLFVNQGNAGPAKQAGYYGHGKTASAEEIAGWDIDIRPDGMGLPPGNGSVEDGEYLYEDKCAECHGSFGEGVDQYPSLAGGNGTLTDVRPHRTVGSYWPHTSTLWDYIHRAMPYTQPESLADDEVYAIVAYVLYLNDLVDDDFVLSPENFTSIELPNKPNFVSDGRPDVKNIRCMEDCRDPASIEILSMVERTAPKAGQDSSASSGTTDAADAIAVYQQACAICHEKGIGGAPIPGEKNLWTKRIANGMETMVKHAIEGFQGAQGMMLPKGGFSHLSDDEVTSVVHYMVEKSQ